jgi:hypothetical protein
MSGRFAGSALTGIWLLAALAGTAAATEPGAPALDDAVILRGALTLGMTDDHGQADANFATALAFRDASVTTERLLAFASKSTFSVLMYGLYWPPYAADGLAPASALGRTFPDLVSEDRIVIRAISTDEHAAEIPISEFRNPRGSPVTMCLCR